jgi:hypothetical protein
MVVRVAGIEPNGNIITRAEPPFRDPNEESSACVKSPKLFVYDIHNNSMRRFSASLPSGPSQRDIR